MTETVQNNYDYSDACQKLGNIFVRVVDPKWVHIVAGFFVEAESEINHFQLFVLKSDADDYEDITAASWENADYDDAILDAQRICAELYKCKHGVMRWTSLTFLLERDGSYRIEFGYEPIISYSGQYLLDWQSRYLTLQEQ